MRRFLHESRRGVIAAAIIIALSSCQGTDSRTTTPEWLLERARKERGSTIAPMHDFQFTDRRAESGITFVDRIVEDAGKNYKAVHYDHGTGLCSADVNGDKRPDLFFVAQLGSSELWKNEGGGRFSNITDASGLRTTDVVGVGCAFGDVDNDGLPDLFMSTVRHGNRLYHNEGGGRFRDISTEAGVDYSGHSSGALFFDYDNDGLLDLFVANVGVYTSDKKGPGGFYVGLADAFHGHTFPERAESSILYRNLGGGRFTDVTQETQLVDFSWSGDAVVVDANHDGYPDLYVLSMQGGSNHLWLNERGRKFTDATQRYFPRTPWGAMGAKVFDANGDGKLDLYVTDMHSDMFTDIAAANEGGERSKSDGRAMPAHFFPAGQDRSILGNALYLRSDSAYTEVSDAYGVETYWPWGPSVDDLNADGWDDMFVTAGMSFPFRYQPNELLMNDGGRGFVPAAYMLGVEPRAGNATTQKWFDLDCNGSDKGHAYCGTCTQPVAAEKGCREESRGKFTVMGTLSSRSSLIVDIDGDGDLDIVTHEFNARPRVLVSDLSTKRKVNWLAVRLAGSRSNRSGIGAQVTVVLPGGRRLLKGRDGKSGYLSMSDVPLYFGLGASEAAESIEVLWPSGKRQVVPGPIAGGRAIDVTEP